MYSGKTIYSLQASLYKRYFNPEKPQIIFDSLSFGIFKSMKQLEVMGELARKARLSGYPRNGVKSDGN